MNRSKSLMAVGVILCLLLSSVAPLILPGTARAQPGDSPWPMFGQNPQRTGQSPYTGPEMPYLKWSFTTGDLIFSFSAPAIGVDGTIYVGSRDNKLYAINPDGSEKWRFTTGNDVLSSPAIGVEGTIYVGSDDSNVYALNSDGSEKWRFTTGDGVTSSPAIGADGTIYVGSWDDNLYALNPDGSQKWRFTTGDWVFSSPAIGADGTIYVGSRDDNLYALNPDGSEKWRFTTGSWVRSSPAIAADGTIYVGSNDGRLYALNPDGTEKWSFATGIRIQSSPAIGADGTIYVGSDDGNVYALNSDGSEKWNFATVSAVYSSPAIGADGTIYVGCRDRNLYAINPDGSEKWRFTAEHYVLASPAIGADGTIYVGSSDRNLYAITEALHYTLAISSTDGGSVAEPGEGDFTYADGIVVDLVAAPAEGYEFVNWTGDVDTIEDVNAASTTITMDGSYAVTATFSSGDGCFIATAAYGTPMAEEIGVLREFRDEYLMTNRPGRAFVDLYYRASPPIAGLITYHPGLKPAVRVGLMPAVAMSTVVVNTTTADKLAILALLALVSLAVALWMTRRQDRGPEYD